MKVCGEFFWAFTLIVTLAGHYRQEIELNDSVQVARYGISLQA